MKSRAVGIATGLLLAAALVYASSAPVPGTDNHMFVAQVNGGTSITIENALFRPGTSMVVPEADLCNAASDGSMYANIVSHKLRYCDGSSWIDLGGGDSGLIIDTTTITGGADTQFLFNSSGVVSSNATFTTATVPTFAGTNTFTGTNTFGQATATVFGTGGIEIDGIATPGTPTVTPQGTTGATTYGYKIVAWTSTAPLSTSLLATSAPGFTPASVEGTTATGNATLDGTNFNRVTWSAVTGAQSYDVYRTTGGAAPPKKLIANTTALTLDDIGIAGSAVTPPVAHDTGYLAMLNRAGTNSWQFRTDMSGASALNNFALLYATLPTVNTAAALGVYFDLTSAGSSSTAQTALAVDLNPGYTGSSSATAIMGRQMGALSTGANLNLNSSGLATGNIGVAGTVAGTSTLQIGVHGQTGSGATTGIGVFGVGNDAGAGAGAEVGVMGASIVGASLGSRIAVAVAALVSDTSGVPTLIPSAILSNNTDTAIPLFVAQDNSAALPTTGATATWTVRDGAQPQYGLGVLTSATMAAESQAFQTTSTSSYTWTNAQVAALAGTAGDITVATLPAKTQVIDAMVVITGAAVGPATVTVSCGDAIGGTPFINYVVPSDAKAAANTVYGDLVTERGTATDAEFWYLPSYTATTLVTCHFISTGANLSTVTGSTGRVMMTTRLLP